MSPVRTAAAAALMLGGALWCFVAALRRVPTTIAAARRQMVPAVGQRGRAGRWGDVLAAGPVGVWMQRRFGAGLEVVELTPAAVLSRAVVGAAAMLFGVGGAVSSLLSMRLLPAGWWWLLLAPLAAGATVVVLIHGVAERIERRRRQVRAAAGDFVQLVAVGLTTDQSVEEAVRFALEVGEGPGFEALRTEVLAAPQRGVALWEALDAVGCRHEVRELCEFGASLERQATLGVAIGDTALTLAATMRERVLDELERSADRANANLAGPTVGFVVSTVVFLAYPLAQRISDAFGG